MSRAFNLTAEINLRGPSNIATVVANMRRQLGTVNANVNINVNPAAIRNSTQLNSALQGLNTTLGQTGTNALAAANAINSFAQAMQRFNAGNLVQGLNNANTAAQNLNNNARNLGRGIGAARTEMEEFGRQSALAVRRFTALGVVTGVIYGITNAAKEGVRSFVEFDKEFVKLQQVTGDSANGLKGLASTLTKLSTGLGVSSGQLATVSSTLAQAGLSARDTERALKALALSSLAPSFDDMNKTVEGSIALMRQFSIGAVDLDKALGSINAVAAKFAVEASDIIAAIQRTGGVFATASRGVSEGTQALNEFVAVFTSVRATTRESAETIATGLRTIFTRIQRADTIEALKEFGVTLTDLDGKFVGAYKAVELLSRGLNSIDPRDLKFSQIVEELGGFRQIGKVIPLIQQFTTAQQALAVAQQGQGTLAEDTVTAQKSLANQTAKVKEEFLALFREIGGTDTFQAMAKGALSLASALIQIADSAKEVLPILSVMLAVRGTSALSQYAVGFAGGLRGGRRYASGGFVPGSGNGDTVPAMLTPGEFVIRKKAVQAIGVDKLHSMNRYASGGVVQKFAQTTPGTNTGLVKPLGASAIASALGIRLDSTLFQKLKARTPEALALRESKTKEILELQKKEIIKQNKLANLQFGLAGLFGTPFTVPSIKAPKSQQTVALFGRVLPKKIAKQYQNMALEGFKKTIINIGTKMASSINASIDTDNTKLNQVIKNTGLGNIVGSALEGSLGLAGSPFSIKTRENASIDFPMGLGVIATKFGLSTNIPTDATRTVGGKGKSIKDFLGQVDRFLAKQKTVQQDMKTTVPTAKLANGGMVSLQKFANGGTPKRNIGYIDSDVLNDPKNKKIVEEQIAKLAAQGVKIEGGYRGYKEYLSTLAAQARTSGGLGKLTSIVGLPGSGKSTLMLGNSQADNARLRKTSRFPILTPEDIARSSSILDVTASVNAQKLNTSLASSDRVIALSSSTTSEQDLLKGRRKKRDKQIIEGISQTGFGRRAGTTTSAPLDSGYMEALLGSQIDPKKLATLGITENGFRRKKGLELPKVLEEKINLYYGHFGPSSKGHFMAQQEGLERSRSRGINKSIIAVGTETPVDPNDPHSQRSALMSQKERVDMASRVFGGSYITRATKDQFGFSLPSLYDVGSTSEGQRLFIKPAKGSTATVGDEKDDSSLRKYKDAGLDPVVLGRIQGISGSKLRDAIMAGDLKKIQQLTTPEGFEYLKDKIPTLQNRAKILPQILDRVSSRSGSLLSAVEQQLSQYPARLTPKFKAEHPEAVEAVEGLRKQRDKIKSSAGFRPGYMMSRLGRMFPSAYGRYANGGSAEDTVPALLTPGEFVINKNAASRIGLSRLNQLNHADKLHGFNRGGPVGHFATGGSVQSFAFGGSVVNGILGMFSRLQPVLNSFIESIRRATAGVARVPAGGGWLGRSMPGVPATGTNPNRNPARNTNNRFQNGLLGASFLLPMITDMMQNGEPSSAQQASSNAMNQGFANSAGIGLSILSMSTGPLGWIGAAAAAGTGFVKALADAKNAARDFNIKDASSKLDDSIEKVNKSLTKFGENTGDAAAKLAATNDVLASIANADKLNNANKETRRGVFNLGDTGAGSFERGEILQRNGIMDYLQTIPLLGGSRASANQAISFQKYIPELSKQAAKNYTGSAEAATKLLETRFKKGETTDSIRAESPKQLEAFSSSLALADSVVQQQIMSIQNSIGINQKEKDTRIANVIAIAGENKIREIQTRSLREKAIEDLNKAANKLSFSLERMFQNMEQSINKTSYNLQALSDSAEQSSLSLSGQGKIGNVSLKAINTLQNPRAYSNVEVGRATNLASSAFGSQAANIAGIIKFGNSIENIIMSTINKFGGNAKGEINNEAVGAKIESAVSQSLRDLNLPPELADKLSGQVRVALKELRQNGEDKVDFSQLMEKIPGLARVIDSAKRAQEVAIKALEQWQAGLNSYAASFNSIMESQIDSNNKLRRANSLLIEGELELAKVFGGSTNLKTLQRNFNLNTQAMTGGAKSPEDIGQNIKDLEAQRRAQQAASDTAANRGAAGMNEFKLMTSRLKDTNIAIRENYDALKHLSENTDMASAAMNKISAIQQKQQAGTNILERLVTSTPEELHDLNGSLIRLSNNMAGRLNASTPEQRKESLDVFNMIAPLLGDKQGAMKANVLEAMVRESGVNQLPPMFQQVIDSLRNPEADPEMAEAIRIYRESLNVQKNALTELTRLNSLMSANTAEKAALSLKTALTGAKLSFESQTLSDIKEGINKLVALGGGKPAAGKATGGVVYASAGQSIFQPKGTDTVPAMLTPGEFVVNRSAAQQNMPLLKAINNGMRRGGAVAYYATGGVVTVGGNQPDGKPWGSLVNRVGAKQNDPDIQHTSQKYPVLYDDIVTNPNSIDTTPVKSIKGNFYASDKKSNISQLSDFGQPTTFQFDTQAVLGSFVKKITLKKPSLFEEEFGQSNADIVTGPIVSPITLGNIPYISFYDNKKEGYLKKDRIEAYKNAYQALLRESFASNITESGNIISIDGQKIDISSPQHRNIGINPQIGSSKNQVSLYNLSASDDKYYGLISQNAHPSLGSDLEYPYWITSRLQGSGGVYKILSGMDNIRGTAGADLLNTAVNWDKSPDNGGGSIGAVNPSLLQSIRKYISYKDKLIDANEKLKTDTIITSNNDKKTYVSQIRGLLNKTLFKGKFSSEDMGSANDIVVYNLAAMWDNINFDSPKESYASQNTGQKDWMELIESDTKNRPIKKAKLPWSTIGFDDKELDNAEENFKDLNSKIQAESAEYNRNGLVFTYSKIKGPLYNKREEKFQPTIREFSAIPLNGDNAETNPFAEAKSEQLAAIVDSVNNADINTYIDQLLNSYDPAKGGFKSDKNYLKTDIIGDYNDMTKNNSYIYSTSKKNWLASKFQKAQAARNKKQKDQELADESKKAPGSEAIFNAQDIKNNLNRQDSINSILANTLFSGSTIPAIRSANFSLYKFNNIKQLPQYAADLLRLKTAFGKKIQSRKNINGNIITNPNQSRAWGMIGSVGSALSYIASGDISRMMSVFNLSGLNGTRGQMINSVIRGIKNYASLLASSGVGYNDVLTRAGVDIGPDKEIEDIYNDKTLLPIQQAVIDANNNVSLKNVNAQDTPKTYLDLGKQILNPLSIFPPQSRSKLFDKLLSIIGSNNINYSSALGHMKSWFYNQDSYIDPSFESSKNKKLIESYLQDQNNYNQSSRDLTMLTHDELGKLPNYKYLQSMKAQRMLFAEEQKPDRKASGGVVYASTGKLINFQPKGTDTVPAMLTPGEFVVNRAATQANLPLLHSINSGSYQSGGVVYAQNGIAVPFSADKTMNDTRQDSTIIDEKLKVSLTISRTSLSLQQSSLGELRKINTSVKDLNNSVNGYASGGVVYASSGKLINFQPKGTDTVPAMLTPGEFVVNRSATQANLPLLRSINSGDKGYSRGGVVYFADGGLMGPLGKLYSKRLLDQRRNNEWLITSGKKAANKNNIFDKNGEEIPFNEILSTTKEPAVLLGNDVNMVKNLAKQQYGGWYNGNDNDYKLLPSKIIYSTINKLFQKQKPALQIADELAVEYKQLSEEFTDQAFTRSLDPKKFNSLKNKVSVNKNLLNPITAKLKDRFSFLSLIYRNSNDALDIIDKAELDGLNIAETQRSIFNGKTIKEILDFQKIASIDEGDIIKKLKDSEPFNKIWDGIQGTFKPINSRIIDFNNKPDNLDSIVKSIGLSSGGVVYASSGKLINFQPKGTDTVPAMLTPGEFVVNRAATQANLPLLRSINSGSYERGGIVYADDGGLEDSYGTPLNAKLAEKARISQDVLDIIEMYPGLFTEEDEKRLLFMHDELGRKQFNFNPLQKSLYYIRKVLPEALRKKIKIGSKTSGPEGFRNYLNQWDELELRQELDEDLKAAQPIPPIVPLSNKKDNNINLSRGGIVYAANGSLINFQPKGTDTVPAMLTPGEFVVNKTATQKNLPLLHSINSSRGGPIYREAGGVASYDDIREERQRQYRQMMFDRQQNYLSRLNNASRARTVGQLASANQLRSDPALTSQQNTQRQQPVIGDNSNNNKNMPDYKKFLDQFADNVKTFGSYIDKLSTIKPIPETITMKGQHEVNVRITGAAAFEGLKQDFMTMLESEISKEMERIWKQSSGQFGRSSAEKTKPKNR
ncbi:MAG: phage tail tape measure protein [Sphingobacteriia bacterium]|nr:phage tail tape measure protein [Sphingobacteriia bacterium]